MCAERSGGLVFTGSSYGMKHYTHSFVYPLLLLLVLLLRAG